MKIMDIKAAKTSSINCVLSNLLGLIGRVIEHLHLETVSCRREAGPLQKELSVVWSTSQTTQHPHLCLLQPSGGVLCKDTQGNSDANQTDSDRQERQNRARVAKIRMKSSAERGWMSDGYDSSLKLHFGGPQVKRAKLN